MLIRALNNAVHLGMGLVLGMCLVLKTVVWVWFTSSFTPKRYQIFLKSLFLSVHLSCLIPSKVIISDSNTLSGPKLWIVTPERYGVHPCHFYMWDSRIKLIGVIVVDVFVGLTQIYSRPPLIVETVLLVGGWVKHEHLVLSLYLIRWIGHRKEVKKLLLRASPSPVALARGKRSIRQIF